MADRHWGAAGKLEEMKKINPVPPAERKEKKEEEEFLSGNDRKNPTPR